MHRNRFILIVAVLVLAMAFTLVGCSGTDDAADDGATEDAGVQVGDNVAAEWTSTSLYLAEVIEVGDEGSITVRYLDDDSEADVEEGGYILIEEKEWAVGDRVLAVWSVARFYSGTIESVEGEEYVVAWDDGSSPSAVTADMIVAYDEQYADEVAE